MTGGPWTEGGLTVSSTWTCEAYGVEAGAVAACFCSADPLVRTCRTQVECARVMRRERERAWAVICANALAGDPTAVYLRGEFTGPDDLLGGPGERPGGDARAQSG